MNKKGFTLVELIAVIAIIVFIGLVVTPEVLDIIKENRENSYHEIEIQDVASYMKKLYEKGSWNIWKIVEKI